MLPGPSLTATSHCRSRRVNPPTSVVRCCMSCCTSQRYHKTPVTSDEPAWLWVPSSGLCGPPVFRLDAAHLRRAGLDYWELLDWQVVDHWSALEEQLPMQTAWLVTKFGQVTYTDARFQQGDILVIGRETNGLPESLRQAHPAIDKFRYPCLASAQPKSGHVRRYRHV